MRPSPARAEAPEPNVWLPILDITGEIARIDLTAELDLLNLEEGTIDLDRELEALEALEHAFPIVEPPSSDESVARVAPVEAPAPAPLAEPALPAEPVLEPAVPAEPVAPVVRPMAPAPELFPSPAPSARPRRVPSRREVVLRRRAARLRHRVGVTTLMVAAAALVAAVVPMLMGGGAPQRNVVVDVDGLVVARSTRATSVGELLADTGVRVGRFDRVVPALSTGLSDGQRIRVLRSVPVTVVVDGVTRAVRTTVRTPRALVRALRLPAGLRVVSSSAPLRAGSTVEFRTPRSVTITVDGRTMTARSLAGTVGGLLAAQDIAIGPNDEVVPAPTTPLSENLHVAVNRFSSDTRAEEVLTAFPTQTLDDPTMPRGQTRVEQPGVNGVARVTYSVRTKNGSVVSKQPVGIETVKAPVTQVVRRGTQPPPPSPTAGGGHAGGTASWYETGPGPKTCAHLTLPRGTVVTIVNRANGNRATCIVGDRGPEAWTGHIIDLSPAVFRQLSSLGTGVIAVDLYW